MRVILLVALNTIKETIRNKILYNILLIAAIALLLSMSFGDLSLFSRTQVMADFGLATMSLTGLLLAVFIGVGMLGSEISTKTVYMVLTKPINRSFFLIGKFSGLLITLLINFVCIALVFALSIYLIGGAIDWDILYALLLLAIEMACITAAAICFSAFTTPTLAAIFTLGFYIAGHLNDLMSIGTEQQQNPIWRTVLQTLYNLLPNLERFNIRTAIIYDLPIPENYIIFAVIYGVLYSSLLLIIASVLLSRKDV